VPPPAARLPEEALDETRSMSWSQVLAGADVSTRDSFLLLVVFL
jgi:hypothetical protein